MIYKPMIATTALVVASCCFSAAAAAPAKEVRSAPVPAAAQADTPYAAYLRKDVPALTAMAEAGSASAQQNLGATSGDASAVKNRDIVASKMTPAQIAEAQRLASAWRKK